MAPSPAPDLSQSSEFDHRLKALGTLNPTTSPPDSQPAPLRLFSTWEICRYMIPVAPGHLRRVLLGHPDLPQGARQGAGTARWFTLPEVQRLRQFFAEAGRAGRTYLPPRPAGAPAQCLAVTGPLAPAARASVCLHLATRAVIAGYRVLVIDLDPGAALSTYLPAPAPASAPRPEAGLTDLLARHYAEYLQSENRARLARGGEPVPVDEALAGPLSRSVEALIRPSLWHGLDVLPSEPALWEAGARIAEWTLAAPGWPSWQALQERLRDDGCLERYDLVLLNAPPVLDGLALSALHLADHVLVPLRPVLDDLTAGLEGLGRIAARFSALETRLNTAARALGAPQVQLGRAQAHILLSPDGPASSALEAPQIAAQLGALVLPAALPRSAALQAPEAVDLPGGFFALAPQQMSRDRYVMARAPLEQAWEALRERIDASWRPETPDD